MRESRPPPPFTRILLYFHHNHIQNKRGDIWIPSERFIVTPVVCPRLLEFLTTLTFGALHRSHLVSIASETIAKKKRRFVVYVRSAMYHEVSRTQPKLEWNVARGNKTRSHVHGGSKKKNDVCDRTQITPQRVFSVTVFDYLQLKHHFLSCLGRYLPLRPLFLSVSFFHHFSSFFQFFSVNKKNVFLFFSLISVLIDFSFFRFFFHSFL